ncbi:MAG: hypothetical protein WBM48_14230 [Polyangiales bacterium]
MKHACISLFAMMAVLFATEMVAAQYGPEEIGAEESPIVDPDNVGDDSDAELEQVESMDGDDARLEAEEPAEQREGRGCSVDSSSSTPSRSPVTALLLLVGLLGVLGLRSSVKRSRLT